ncbi:hypothetical protein [Stenotrophomonas sp.]|uniref:hypothetical protein n=1 Tax=Stenotrophomonas sp. TaxID=69392 RepID=UPI0028B0BCA2|nr:hypothetical protein [Stenotrophomonas sp.]
MIVESIASAATWPEWIWTAMSAVAGILAAVATLFAALVALIVGVMPIALSNVRRRQQAKVLAQILADDLFIQEVHIRGALGVPRDANGLVSAWEYDQIAKATGLIDPTTAVQFVSFSPDLPKSVAEPLAQAVAMMHAAKQRRTFLEQTIAGKTYNVGVDTPWYTSVAKDILELRKALHNWIETPLQECGESVQVLSHNLRQIANAQKIEWLREKAVQEMKNA